MTQYKVTTTVKKEVKLSANELRRVLLDTMPAISPNAVMSMWHGDEDESGYVTLTWQEVNVAGGT